MSSKNLHHIQSVISDESKNRFSNDPIKILANPGARLVPMAVHNFFLNTLSSNSKKHFLKLIWSMQPSYLPVFPIKIFHSPSERIQTPSVRNMKI